MGYWCSIPSGIIKSKKLTSEEKELWCIISINLNEGGYCTAGNAELADALGASIKTITTRLASLKKKNFIHIIFNQRTHQRRIYLRPPNNPATFQEGFGPSVSELQSTQRRIQESLKKAIVFGTIEFDVLIQKLLESPYLHEIKDNSVQFIVSREERNFLHWLTNYTDKEIDCQIACYEGIDFEALMENICESKFLLENKNINLKWLLEHSDEILKGKYKLYQPYFAREEFSTVKDEIERRKRNFDY